MAINFGMDGYEASAFGKILLEEKINKNAMYRVLRSLWFTKTPVSFVELKDGVYLVKFEWVKDH